MKNPVAWALAGLCLIFAAFGAGLGFLFHHTLAGMIVGALFPLGITAIAVLGGIMFFHAANKLFDWITGKHS